MQNGVFMLEKIKERKWMIIVIILVAVIGIGILLYPIIEKCLKVSDFMQRIFSEQNQSANVELMVDFGEDEIKLDTTIYVVQENGKSVFALGTQEHLIYISGNVLYLENGKAFRLLEKDYSNLTEIGLFWELYRAGEITKAESQYKIVYDTTVGDENTPVHITADFSNFVDLDADTSVITAEVLSSMKDIDEEQLPALGTDMYRLFTAGMEFSERQEKVGTVELDVSCGVLDFDVTLPWNADGINSSEITNPEDIAAMPALIYALFLEGDFSSEEVVNTTTQEVEYIYTLALDEQATQKLANMIAPEIVNQVVNLTGGNVYITVAEDKFDKVEVDISGKVSLLIVEVDASIGATFTFE